MAFVKIPVSLKARALRYLSQREHSVEELRRKLKRLTDEANAAQLEPLLVDLQTQGFLSNERYAAARVRTRSARYGNMRLVAELKQMGIDPSAAKNQVEAADDEVTRIQELIARKPIPKDFSEKAKLMRSLQMKGFSGQAIKVALKKAAIVVDSDEFE